MYKNSLPDVPPCFVNSVHVTLYKLVGVQLLAKDLVTPDFFQKMRVRFQNASKKVGQWIVYLRRINLITRLNNDILTYTDFFFQI